jgi:uncharacterized protein
MSSTPPVRGRGLGLRRVLLRALEDQHIAVDFLEVAPENWIDVGGPLGRRFRALVERHPLVCHGLSLNLGGPAPLDEAFVRRVGQFLEQHRVRCYSEHLSFCADDGHLYDLLPIPFTAQAIEHVAARIRRVQHILGRRIAIENVSYYAAPGRQMSELEFVNAVLVEADCDLMLDVNNVFVNAINHGYDPRAFLAGLPGERIAWLHTAGHYVEAPDLRVDTHGADVCEEVWTLLGETYARFGAQPTVLERDFNFPPLPSLLAEVARIRGLQAARG